MAISKNTSASASCQKKAKLESQLSYVKKDLTGKVPKDVQERGIQSANNALNNLKGCSNFNR